jgi:hypothetical protein
MRFARWPGQALEKAPFKAKMTSNSCFGGFSPGQSARDHFEKDSAEQGPLNAKYLKKREGWL